MEDESSIDNGILKKGPETTRSVRWEREYESSLDITIHNKSWSIKESRESLKIGNLRNLYSSINRNVTMSSQSLSLCFKDSWTYFNQKNTWKNTWKIPGGNTLVEPRYITPSVFRKRPSNISICLVFETGDFGH